MVILLLEISPGIYIASDLPVLYLKNIDAIVLSDVHIGYEEEMARKGMFLPKVQKKRFIEVYRNSGKVFKFKRIVINGDFKHLFNKLGKEERDDLNEILSTLKDDGIEVTLVKGNHDNYVTLVTDKFDNVEVVDYLDLGNVFLLHGHKEVEVRDNTTYVIGHEHPRISIRDRLGFAKKLQAFLVVPLKSNGSKVIVLPSVGTYQAGNDISLIHNNYMSPIVRNFGVLEKAKPYVIIESEGIMEFPELGLLKNVLF